MSLSHTLAALILAFAAIGTALAQTPPPAASAPAAAAPDMSKCEKPDPHPGRLASTEKMRGWNKQVSAWQDCMKKYIAEVQGRADAAVKVANAAVAESNAAVSVFNATVKELQAQVEAAQ